MAALIDAERLVVKTAVLEAIADEWMPDLLRRAQRVHRGQLRIAHDGLLLSRVVPLPER